MNYNATILLLVAYRCVLILFACGWWVYLWKMWKNQRYTAQYDKIISADKNPKMFRLNFSLSIIAGLFLTVGGLWQMWELIQMFNLLNE